MLTKKDSGDGQHHFIDKSQVATVEGNKVKLSQKASSLKLQSACAMISGLALGPAQAAGPS